MADQVLVQPQLVDVATCGVVFSRTLTGQPYYVVNSDSSGRTDVVTSGASGSDVMFVRHGTSLDRMPAHASGAIQLVLELQTVLHHESLDVEYAVNRSGEFFLLQVRPLVAASKYELADGVDTAFNAAQGKVGELHNRPRGIGVLSDMSDWNPAELIGGRPRPLAASMFDYVITQKTWRVARARLGYAHPAGAGLLQMIAAHPYIDVRASAASLLPESLDSRLRDALVEEALGYLAAHPELHDKIEFVVVPTAFTPAYDQIFARFAETFEPAELDDIRTSIRQLTEKLIQGVPATVGDLIAEMKSVDAARTTLVEGAQDDLLGTVEALVGSARERGFELFGAIARLAFVGTACLRGLVHAEAIEVDRSDRFLRSLRTVAGELADAMDNYASGAVGQQVLLEQFGHLRPSTFDITSPRYDERPDLYLDGAKARRDMGPSSEPFAWKSDELERISGAIREAGMDIDATLLLRFVADATVAREEAKLIASRTISDALRLITIWGRAYGLTRDDLSFLTLDEIFWLRGNPAGGERVRSLIEIAAARYAADSTVLMPDVITSPDDLNIVTYVGSQPNFCGSSRVVSPPRLIQVGAACADITGHIVLIESADPGFDWVLTRSISGLVTRYGGAASHMAIRCAEFNVPAAIGVGARFEALTRAARIDLDPINHRVESLS